MELNGAHADPPAIHDDFTLLLERNCPARPSVRPVWCPTMDLLAVATIDNAVHLYRLTWEKMLSIAVDADSFGIVKAPVVSLPSNTPLVCSLCWRPDGRVLAVGLKGGYIATYNVEDGQRINVMKGLNGSVTALKWVTAEETDQKKSSAADPSASTPMMSAGAAAATAAAAADAGRSWDRASTFFEPLPAVPKPTAMGMSSAASDNRQAPLARSVLSEDLHVLIAGDDEGFCHLYALGSFSILSFNAATLQQQQFNEVTGSICRGSNSTTSIIAFSMDPALQSLAVLLRCGAAAAGKALPSSEDSAMQTDGNDQLVHASSLLGPTSTTAAAAGSDVYLVRVDCSILATRRHELLLLARQSVRVSELVRYLEDCVQAMQLRWMEGRKGLKMKIGSLEADYDSMKEDLTGPSPDQPPRTLTTFEQHALTHIKLLATEDKQQSTAGFSSVEELTQLLLSGCPSPMMHLWLIRNHTVTSLMRLRSTFEDACSSITTSLTRSLPAAVHELMFRLSELRGCARHWQRYAVLGLQAGPLSTALEQCRLLLAKMDQLQLWVRSTDADVGAFIQWMLACVQRFVAGEQQQPINYPKHFSHGGSNVSSVLRAIQHRIPRDAVLCQFLSSALPPWALAQPFDVVDLYSEHQADGPIDSAASAVGLSHLASQSLQQQLHPQSRSASSPVPEALISRIAADANVSLRQALRSLSSAWTSSCAGGVSQHLSSLLTLQAAPVLLFRVAPAGVATGGVTGYDISSALLHSPGLGHNLSHGIGSQAPGGHAYGDASQAGPLSFSLDSPGQISAAQRQAMMRAVQQKHKAAAGAAQGMAMGRRPSGNLSPLTQSPSAAMTGASSRLYPSAATASGTAQSISLPMHGAGDTQVAAAAPPAGPTALVNELDVSRLVGLHWDNEHGRHLCAFAYRSSYLVLLMFLPQGSDKTAVRCSPERTAGGALDPFAYLSLIGSPPGSSDVSGPSRENTDHSTHLQSLLTGPDSLLKLVPSLSSLLGVPEVPEPSAPAPQPADQLQLQHQHQPQTPLRNKGPGPESSDVPSDLLVLVTEVNSWGLEVNDATRRKLVSFAFDVTGALYLLVRTSSGSIFTASGLANGLPGSGGGMLFGGRPSMTPSLPTVPEGRVLLSSSSSLPRSVSGSLLQAQQSAVDARMDVSMTMPVIASGTSGSTDLARLMKMGGVSPQASRPSLSPASSRSVNAVPLSPGVNTPRTVKTKRPLRRLRDGVLSGGTSPLASGGAHTRGSSQEVIGGAVQTGAGSKGGAGAGAAEDDADDNDPDDELDGFSSDEDMMIPAGADVQDSMGLDAVAGASALPGDGADQTGGSSSAVMPMDFNTSPATTPTAVPRLLGSLQRSASNSSMRADKAPVRFSLYRAEWNDLSWSELPLMRAAIAAPGGGGASSASASASHAPMVDSEHKAAAGVVMLYDLPPAQLLYVDKRHDLPTGRPRYISINPVRGVGCVGLGERRCALFLLETEAAAAADEDDGMDAVALAADAVDGHGETRADTMVVSDEAPVTVNAD